MVNTKMLVLLKFHTKITYCKFFKIFTEMSPVCKPILHWIIFAITILDNATEVKMSETPIFRKLTESTGTSIA